MKKICLTVIGLYLLLLNAFSQAVTKDTTKDASKEISTEYIDKPLQLEETNIVSSYYHQDGNHSAVTGGIGTEKVTDLSNGLELKFVGSDLQGHKYTLTTRLKAAWGGVPKTFGDWAKSLLDSSAKGFWSNSSSTWPVQNNPGCAELKDAIPSGKRCLRSWKLQSATPI